MPSFDNQKNLNTHGISEGEKKTFNRAILRINLNILSCFYAFKWIDILKREFGNNTIYGEKKIKHFISM